MGGELCVASKAGWKATWIHSDICHILEKVLKVESNRQPVKVPLGVLEWALHESLSEAARRTRLPPGLPQELLEKLRSVQEFSSLGDIPSIPQWAVGLRDTLYRLHSSCQVDFIFRLLMVPVENSPSL